MSINYSCIKLLLKSLDEVNPVFIKIFANQGSLKIEHVELNTLAQEVREELLVDLYENLDAKFKKTKTNKQKELVGISSFLLIQDK